MLESLQARDFIQIGMFLIGGLGFIYAMKGDLKMLAQEMRLQGQRLDGHAAEIKQLVNIIKDQAVMNERMNAMDRAIDDIRHGRGFVIHREFPSSAPTIFEQR